MNNVYHTTEHKLKEGLNHDTYNEWISRLKAVEEDTKITIVYSAEEPTVGDELLDVAKKFPTKNKILLFGECHEKGGGGEGMIPTVFQYYSTFVVITISAVIAKVFLEEFAKDIYRATVHKLFSIRKKAKHTKTNKTVALKISNGMEFIYIFGSSLSETECVEGLKIIPEHSKRLTDSDYNGSRIFAYSPNDKEWFEL